MNQNRKHYERPPLNGTSEEWQDYISNLSDAGSKVNYKSLEGD